MSSFASLTVFSCLLWLCWRAKQVWSTPLNIILRHLQIELPNPPKLTIDALGTDSVSLHWVTSGQNVKKHIIQMDGQDVGISVRGETSVTISGLTANYLYSIQVIAVNTQGYRVPSSTVYVRTRPRNEDDDDSDEEASTPIDNKSKSKEVQRDDEKQEAKALVVDHKDAADVIEKEKAELENQIVALQETHAAEEAEYLKKIDTLRQKKKEEDDVRLAKDSHHKQLDQQKREIETKRNQLQKLLKAEQDEYRKQCTDIKSYKSSTKNSIETAEHLEESMNTLATDTEDAIRDAERIGAIAAEELSEIEAEIRYLLSRKAESESELARLMSESRVPSPTPQEKVEEQQARQLWKEREDSLAKQYDEVHATLMKLQNASFQERNVTPPMDIQEHTTLRRRVSRHGRPDQLNGRSTALPAFNPDAAPFVAGPVYGQDAANQGIKSVFETAQFSPVKTTFSHDPTYPYGTTSIFNDEHPPRNPSPFIRRDSPISSQSGSDPSSPGIAIRALRPSIFSQTIPPSRKAANGLISSLNGTPIEETSVIPPKEKSKWSWSTKKQNDPLALDRKNTRSLPKSDVAPIGTRRRSGSLREDHGGNTRPHNPLTAYHDLDVIEVITSTVLDTPSTHDLPRPSGTGAFGWAPSPTSMPKRSIPNPWSERTFDPFGEDESGAEEKDGRLSPFVGRVFGKKDEEGG